MGLKLHMYESSLCSRSVLITGAALGINIEKKIMDMAKEEHKSPEFLKINPQHCVPTLIDGDYVLWESHAILPYLVEKYGKDDWLYPKNLQKRGTIMQRLHFNNSTVYPVLQRVAKTVFGQKSLEIPEEQVNEVVEIYKLLDGFLGRTRYIADNHATVADFSIIVCIEVSELIVPIDGDKYSKLYAWVESMKRLPCYQVNVPGFEEFKAMFAENLKK